LIAVLHSVKTTGNNINQFLFSVHKIKYFVLYSFILSFSSVLSLTSALVIQI